MNERLEELGAEVARIQDETLADGRRRAAVRRRLLSEIDEAPPPERASRWVPWVAWTGAMAAIALVITLLWPTAPEPIAYRVDGSEQWSQVTRSIAAPDDRATSIGFTDGSSVRLGRSARARIERLTADGVMLRLDRGEASFEIRHRQTTRWSVEAGPFLVQVTGTRFRVRWEPEDESFELAVLEGEVRVSGPGVPETPVRDGQQLRNTVAQEPPPDEPEASEAPIDARRPVQSERMAPRSEPGPTRPVRTPPSVEREIPRRGVPAAKTTSDESYRPPGVPLELKLPPKNPGAPEAKPAPPSSEVAPQEPPPPTAEPEPVPPAAEPSWRALIDRGEYAEVLRELRPEEVEQALWEASPSELIGLGAAARQMGDARASYIYSVIRSRFASTDAASDAAFVLGRMQFHSGAYGASATWFETYLRERPDGRLAREASGRVVEAYRRSGDTDRARAAAEAYLRRYPSGPHAELCRTVLQ